MGYFGTINHLIHANTRVKNLNCIIVIVPLSYNNIPSGMIWKSSNVRRGLMKNKFVILTLFISIKCIFCMFYFNKYDFHEYNYTITLYVFWNFFVKCLIKYMFSTINVFFNVKNKIIELAQLLCRFWIIPLCNSFRSLFLTTNLY